MPDIGKKTSSTASSSPDIEPSREENAVASACKDASELDLDYDAITPQHIAIPEESSISAPEVRQQLDRILNSKTFQQVQRLKRFINFVVTETNEGRGEKLKEFVVGFQVFDKESSFDPRNDPIVRVQARRLRTRLATYYAEEGQNDEILIELPKGGYAAVFKRRSAPISLRAGSEALIGQNAIAVRSFADYSPDNSLGYFCQGLAHEIIHTLTKLDTVRVIARDVPQKSKPGAAISRLDEAPKVTTFVTGSVRKSGERLRITAQMVDAASGNYLWSESIDGNGSNLFAIQEAVAQAVLKRLQAGLVQGGTISRRIPRENLAAYNWYVQGRYHLSQRTEEGLRKAIEFFEKVVAEDQRYAEAYSGLADAYELLGHYGVLAPGEVWTKAASNATWAVMQDANSAEAHTSLAHVKSTQDWDWAGAEQEFKRAIRLNPHYPTAHHWYAVSCLAPLNRLSEAFEEIQLAQALDPIALIIARDVAMVLYYKREFEAALDQCDHTIELNPHFAPAYWLLGLIQEQMRDLDESMAAFQRAVQLTPHSPRMRAAVSRSLAMYGKTKEARRILHELQKLSEERYVSPFEIASINFALGEADLGFEWLKKSFQDRCFELISINVDPRFNSIKEDPRFATLRRQLRLEK